MEREAAEMKAGDWEFYKEPAEPGRWIRKAGEAIFDTLHTLLMISEGEEEKKDNAILFSESGKFFAGIPYDYRAYDDALFTAFQL